jgi:uncharacterized protein YyaL (SSP411 family)
MTMRGLLLLAIFALGSGAEPPQDKEKKKANRLAKESSPYLLQHAYNPVDWYPWGEEAFAKAQKEGKLVFLSIGYSSCHWCHVMERESFANEAVAKFLNEHFVCIKVDREERPDIDQIYMAALHALGIRGGWPLSMWLTPNGKPIVGGTYWPREDREIEGQKVRGFVSLCKVMQDFWTKDRKDIEEKADTLAKGTAEILAGTARGIAIVELERGLVDAVVDGLKEEFDPEHGGFGNPRKNFVGTKFPVPPYLRLLQAEAARKKDAELAKIVHLTLEKMACGGIYDHLGGGFARYSTERTWTVPHFEKMLYDNAQLLEVYARAYTETKKPLYEQVLRETIAYLAREGTSPEGGFYSALDADSEEEEGRYYVWTPKELEEALPDKAERDLFKAIYASDGKVNFEEKYHILRLAKPLEAIAAERKTTLADLQKQLDPIKAKLLAVRAKRARPLLDTKVLTAWNGQMIAGLALAGQALDDRKAIAAASKAADFLLNNLRTKQGRLLRVWGASPGEKPSARLNAYLDDYVYLVHGLLTLHDVTGEARWLTEAKTLTDVMSKYHLDEKVGGFFYTSSDHEKLFARAKDQYDSAQPAGNSVAARNLVRLWAKTGEKAYQERAEKCLQAFAGPLKSVPTSLSTMAEALGEYLDRKK